MRTITRLRLALVGAVIAALALVGLALAQGGFDLGWYTVDGGGARSSGGGYTLEGSIGQPDAGTVSGGSYSLQGGYWAIDGTQTPTATPSATPTGTLTVGATPTSTLTPSATPTSTATPTPFAAPFTVQEARDDTDEPQKETENERRQRARTNQGSKDDESTEGNVLETRCDQPWPSVIIANRDGEVEVRLTREAQAACRSIEVGDYLEADGEKQHEFLFDASDVTVTRNGQKVH